MDLWSKYWKSCHPPFKWVSEWVSQPFPPDIQNIIASKPLELESWHFDRMFTPPHMSCVTCHVSRVTCHLPFYFSFKKMEKGGGASRWRVCYQRGLPRLVSGQTTIQKVNRASTRRRWAPCATPTVCPDSLSSSCTSVGLSSTYKIFIF